MNDRRDEEIEANFAAFQTMLPTLMALVPGKYALMKDRQVVAAFDDLGEVVTEACSRYGVSGLFSIQHVTDVPVCLGWYSYVEPLVGR